MIIGYARVSTVEQEAGFVDQIAALQRAGCEKIFQEQASAIGERAELEHALDFARQGDTFIVTKPDRLARSVADLCKIVERLSLKNVTLKIQSMNIDTSTPTGKLMLNLLGSIAQFERELMLERQRIGIAKAKEDGKYKGKPAYAVAKTDEIMELRASGMRVPDIAGVLGLGNSTVWRIIAQKTG